MFSVRRDSTIATMTDLHRSAARLLEGAEAGMESVVNVGTENAIRVSATLF